MDNINNPRDQYQTAEFNDCLYRAKGKSEWLMPVIEQDEYLVFVNKWPDFLKEIHAKAGPATHSISFGRFDFKHPSDPKSTLQIQSTSREAKLAALCPKYVTKPLKVHALFNHWPTSWDADSQSVGLPQHHLVGFHYRLKASYENATSADTRLSNETSILQRKLHERFGVEFPQFNQQVHAWGAEIGGSVISSFAQSQMDSQEEQYARQVPTWIEDFNRRAMNEVAPFIVSPPQDLSFHGL